MAADNPAPELRRGPADRNLVGLVAAGWSPREDEPLAASTCGRPKPLLPIAGKPMVTHVVEALAAVRGVRQVLVVGLGEADMASFAVPAQHLPPAGDLVANIVAGFAYATEHYPAMEAVLYSSCDVPLLTPAILDAFVEECFSTDHELYCPVVEPSVMERRFPPSGRSYVRLCEGDFTSGDVLLLRAGLTVGRLQLLRDLRRERKHILRQARALGLGTLLKLVTGRLSLAEAEACLCRALEVRGRAVPFPHAEVGMDVDNYFQLEIVREELEARDRERA